MHCAPGFTATTPDPYDAEFATAFNTMYAAQVASSGFLQANTIIFQADDGDNVGVMNSCCNPNNAHPDYGYVIASNSPVQSVSSSTAGGGHPFSNKTYFVKLAMRDFLAAEYGCTGSADPANGSYCGCERGGDCAYCFQCGVAYVLHDLEHVR